MNYSQIIDANLNRAAEGLRVIEDYCRFVAENKALSLKLSQLRKTLNLSEGPDAKIEHLQNRNTEKDMRAKEIPTQRASLSELLTANFKRVQEALRVLEEYSGNPSYNEARYDSYELEKEICLGLLKPKIKPGIYLISHDIEILKKGLALGVSLIQLRDKEGNKASLYQQAKIIAPMAKEKGIPFIVNDFLDIALAVNADGLHTGQDDMAIDVQRELLGPHKLIGRSSHNIEQGLAAQKAGADYVSVGPIWETPSKPGRKSIGFDYLKVAKEQLSIPYVAIGGINRENCDAIIAETPPLLGLIRDHEGIPELQETMATARKSIVK